ncbi:MAG: flagellar hook-associated protein FlgK [Betaproteobacteria bacterium]|nr:flagellar hook-associated protein FlgK [Betaproteobacteria bacterium]
MGSNVFNIGLTGLNAAQAHLATAGHNIANAATPGFHRQRVELQNGLPQASGDGFFGTGVDVATVSRIYSEFLDNQVSGALGRQAYLNTYRDEIAQIDNLLADANSGLTPALSEFFNTVHEVGSDPESAATRQAMLSGAGTLVSRFRSIEARVSQMYEAANGQIADLVTSINGLATEIARLNQSVIVAEGAAGGHAANDLRDQRDAVIAELNKLTGVTTVAQSDGSLNVMIGTGQSLVVGNQALALATSVSREDPKRLEIGYTSASGTAIITSSLTGGQLGAVLAFQRDAAAPTLNNLGRIATALAFDFNQQHRLGQDLNGAAGTDFFTLPTPGVIGRTGNSGSAVLDATVVDASALTTSDYRIAYNAGNYSVTRLSDSSVTVYASLPQTIDGVRVSLGSGTPGNGDSFLLQPTRTGARDLAVRLVDGSQIAAAAPIRGAAGTGNTSGAAITAGVVNGPPPTNANLLQPVTITFTGSGSYDVSGVGTGNPTGLAYVSGGDISYNGWTVSIAGAPRAGDTFTITPNSGGVSDNRNATLLAGLQSAKTIGGGAATYQGAYSQSVASVGSKTREVQVAAAAQEALVTQTTTAQQSLSGVNLDEEAANLIRYQQMYQACGKMIEIVSKLFDTLLAI